MEKVFALPVFFLFVIGGCGHPQSNKTPLQLKTSAAPSGCKNPKGFEDCVSPITLRDIYSKDPQIQRWVESKIDDCHATYCL